MMVLEREQCGNRLCLYTEEAGICQAEVGCRRLGSVRPRLDIPVLVSSSAGEQGTVDIRFLGAVFLFVAFHR